MESLLSEAIKGVEFPGYRGILFFKSSEQRVWALRKSRQYFANLNPNPKYNTAAWNWIWPNGAKITIDIFPNSEDQYKYAGIGYQFMFIDNSVQINEQIGLYLTSRLQPAIPGLKVRLLKMKELH